MTLAAGTRLGPYEITAPIGAGGMGEVYKARDTRLGRDVAIKVLPDHLSRDAGRRERFEREARAVSSLNHPHICTLFDIGSQGGVDFLVMEHLEGETLADRLKKGALLPEQVMPSAIQIADALDKAHRQGVVHRDLKPGNVMLTKSGAKLLDFGLAKLRDGGEAGSAAGSVLPTATRNLTAEGTILGTFQYMAPEQLEGKEADARTDIFALGVLLYEMATGRKAFEGNSQASLIASILKEQPRPIAELQPVSPAGLDRVVRACLAKDPEERIQTAHDVKLQLQWVADGGLASGTTSREMPASQVAGAVSGVARRGGVPGWLLWPAAAALAAVLFAAGYLVHAPAPPPVMRVNLDLPPKTQLDGQNTSLALSPDGKTLAFAATGPEGKRMLWVRALDSLQAQPLAGTEDATYPFWSPDGRSLGFFADRKLKKIQASGGTAQTLCDAIDGRGASWGAEGVIVFSPAPFGGLSQVSAAGGAPSAATTPEDDGTTHRLPRFLPDGRRLLFFTGHPGKDQQNGIHALHLGTKKVTLVANENSEGRYVSPGFLTFVREGNLMAQPMDLRTLRLSGEAVPVAEKVQFNPARWTGAFTFSETGLMLYEAGASITKARLAWFDAQGKEIKSLGEPASILEVALSPDAQRAVATVLNNAGTSDLWMYDLVRGVGSRFTFQPEGAYAPVWSPDGRQVAYSGFGYRLFIKAADGASEPRAVLEETGGNHQVDDWSPDGKTLLFWKQSAKTGFDIFLLPVTGEARPQPLIVTAAGERFASFSPDSRWLLYVSDESGRRELYVVSYPGAGGKWQISTAGGAGGGWVENGRRIIYGDLDSRLFSVNVAAQGANLVIGAPRPIFGGRPSPDVLAVAKDGQRFLAAVPQEESTSPMLVLVSDWTSGLKTR